jgi:hypothetical protein
MYKVLSLIPRTSTTGTVSSTFIRKRSKRDVHGKQFSWPWIEGMERMSQRQDFQDGTV